MRQQALGAADEIIIQCTYARYKTMAQRGQLSLAEAFALQKKTVKSQSHGAAEPSSKRRKDTDDVASPDAARSLQQGEAEGAGEVEEIDESPDSPFLHAYGKHIAACWGLLTQVKIFHTACHQRR